MKSLFRRVLKLLTLFAGVAISGILLLPAGVLVMLVSFIWKTTDVLVSRLEDDITGSRRAYGD